MDKIICLGKNYLDHAKELGDAVPENPVIFIKPPSIALDFNTIQGELEVTLPQGCGPVHHECEIILKIGSEGKVTDVSLGLDLTLRDLQAELKKKGHPWEISKIFPGSAVIGPWCSVKDFPDSLSDYLNQEFAFILDGKVRQVGQGSQMRMGPEACIQYISQFFPLCEGDVVFTGTPAGVGPLSSGQVGQLKWGMKMNYYVKFV